MTYKEIVSGNQLNDTLVEGLHELASAVLSTMGPMGKTVIIQDTYGKPYVTKDGVSVANAIKFKDPVKNMVATLIKQVAQKTADEAGDGTTTSICLTEAFVNIGMEILSQEVPITELQNLVDQMVKDVVVELNKNSRKLKKKNIEEVAMISSNGDKEIAKLVNNAYKHSDLVKVEEGKDAVDNTELVDGMLLESSYMSNYFVNNENKKEVNFENARVIVSEDIIEKIGPFEQVINRLMNDSTPLVFFVNDVSEQVLLPIIKLKKSHGVPICVVKAPGFGNYRKDYLRDIATLTGAECLGAVNTDIDFNVLGIARKIVVTKLNTIITKAHSVDVTEKINELREQKKTAKLNEYDRDFISDRIANLTGKLSIISVGGKSEVEMKERKDRIEDAVLAVKCALEEGIVEGGGLAFYKTYNTLSKRKDKNDIYKTLLSVVLAPYFQIHNNSDGKINCDTKEDRFLKGIIDPLKVTRCALENAASVAKTLLSTSAVVLNEEVWN